MSLSLSQLTNPAPSRTGRWTWRRDTCVCACCSVKIVDESDPCSRVAISVASCEVGIGSGWSVKYRRTLRRFRFAKVLYSVSNSSFSLSCNSGLALLITMSIVGVCHLKLNPCTVKPVKMRGSPLLLHSQKLNDDWPAIVALSTLFVARRTRSDTACSEISSWSASSLYVTSRGISK